MKIATAAYHMTPPSTWSDYAQKIEDWVAEAAGQGADLLLFPEYGAMELAMLDGPDVAADLERSLHAVSDRIPDADDLHADLSARYNVHICAATGPVFDDEISPRPVNRARFFSPAGGRVHQDKQIMTRYERAPMDMAPCQPLKLFDTALGKIAILTCYDSEFPLLGRSVSEADILLVPSCTEALSGYWRVRIGAMARALENQCVSVMSSLVGLAEWTDVADTTTGAGGIFGPPDIGFPDTGVLSEGALNTPGWTYAEVDLAKIAHVRADGRVLNRTHWNEQPKGDTPVKLERLS
jgi:predicted amidohydrolase